MTSLKWVLLGTAAGAMPVAAGAQAIPSVPACSVSCQSELARDQVRTPEGRQQAYERARGLLEPVTDAGGAVASALDQYRHKRENWDTAIDAARYARDLAAIGAAAAGDFQVPFAGTFAAFGDIAFDRGITLLEGARDGQVGTLLETALLDVRRQDEEKFQQLAKLDPAAARTQLFGTAATAGIFQSTKLYTDLDPGARAMLVDAKVDLLARALQREAQASADHERKTDQEIAAIGARLTDYETKLGDFARSTKAALTDLREGQDGLKVAFRLLGDEVKDHSYRLDSLERVAFGQLSPKEQVAALQSGMFRSVVQGLSPKKRAEFDEGLAKAARLQTAQQYLSDANVVVNGLQSLSSALGLGPQFAEPLAFAQKGVAIAQVVLAGATGNPIAIMSALGSAGGLFGGRSDPVQGELKALRKEIMALRRDIYEMRREMFEYHRETMVAITRLSDQIDANYRSLYRQGQSTYNLLAFVERGVSELLLADISHCKPVLQAWEGNGTYATRRALLNGALRTDLNDCHNGLNSRFATNGMTGEGTGVSTIFFLGKNATSSSPNADYSKRLEQALRFEKETLRPTVSYAERYLFQAADHGKCASGDLLYLALTAPVFAFGDGVRAAEGLKAKCAAGAELAYRLFSTAELFDPAARGEKVNGGRVLGDLLSGQSISYYGDQALRLSPMWEFSTDENNARRIHAAKDIAAGTVEGAGVETSTIMLRNVRDILSASIAQQNLLAGDLLVPQLEMHVEGAMSRPAADFAAVRTTTPGKDKEAGCESAFAEAPPPQPAGILEYADAACLLAHNALLRQNFMMHWVRNSLRNPQSGPVITYAVGIDHPDPIYISRAFKKTLPLVWDECTRWAKAKGWCVKLPAPRVERPQDLDVNIVDGNMLIPLPAWPDLAAYRPARTHDGALELLSLRARIEDRLTTYQAFPDLSDAEKQVLAAGILAASAPAPTSSSRGVN